MMSHFRREQTNLGGRLNKEKGSKDDSQAQRLKTIGSDVINWENKPRESWNAWGLL